MRQFPNVLLAAWVGLALLLGAPSVPGGEDVEAAYREGSLALRHRDYPAAIAAFERALSLAPEDTRTLLSLGIARSALRDFSGAVEAYERLLSLEPDHSRALNNLGNVHYRQGQHERAAIYYGKALEADPRYLRASFHYGRALWELNRNEEAERVLEQCLSIPAEDDRQRKIHLDCQFYRGAVRFRAGDFSTAAAVMESIVTIFPSHPEARYYLGMSYRRLGRLDEARQQLELHQQILRTIRGDETVEKQHDR